MVSRRRKVVVALVIVTLAVGLVDELRRDDASAVPARPEAHAAGAPDPSVGEPGVLVSGRPPAVLEFTARADAVTEACDLPVETRCEGDACVALLHSPDLDHALGWLGLVTVSPRFVASTVLRDLGVPASTSRCGAAIGAMVEGAGVPMIELPDGTELWCAAAAGGEALCDRAAAELHGVDGFTAPGVRHLSFDG